MAAEQQLQSLLVRLRADASKYIKGLRDATRETEKFTRGVDGKLRDSQGRFVTDTTKMGVALNKLATKLKSTGKELTRFGRSMSLKVTAPIAAVGLLSVRAFANFDKAMVESTSIMKVTAGQTKQMRNLALSLGQKGIQGPTELAKSYFFLASAGLDAEQSMAALPQVARFATAGAFDMALATDLLTDAQSALGLSSKDAAKNLKGLVRLSDVLVKANTLANTSVQQVSEALTNTAGASLRAFSKDVEEGVAVLAAFADQGVKSNVAGTNLSRIMLLLSKASRRNARQHRDLGFAVFDTSGKMRNFADIIGNIESVIKGMSDETKSAKLEMLGFEVRVQQAILPLLGTSEAIRTYEKALRDAKGITAEVANKQLKAFANQVIIVKNQLTAVGIEIGEILVPHLTKLLDWVKRNIAGWREWSVETKKFAIASGGVLATVGPLAIVIVGFRKLITVVKFAIGILLSMVGVVGLLKAALVVGFAFALAKAMRIVANGTESARKFNNALKETIELNSKLVRRTAAKNQGIFETASGLDPQKKTGFLEKELDSAVNNLQGMRLKVIANRKEAEKLEPTWRSFGQKGKAIWEAQKRQMDESISRFKVQRSLVIQLQKEIEKSKKADSDRGIKLAQKKAAQEDLGAKLGGIITGALSAGGNLLQKAPQALSAARNKLALEAFKRSFDVPEIAKNQVQRTQAPLASRQAVRAGSAQAQQRLAQFRARTSGNAKQKPEVKKLGEIKEVLLAIKDSNEAIANKEGADLEPANL